MAAFPDWIYRQSAVLPYRRSHGGLEVLLITSRGGRRWVLPKGIVEPGMTAPASAAKEAREEAGLEGAVSQRALGRYCQEKWGGTCRIEVFPMRVTTELEDWPEAGVRQRKWLSLNAAINRVKGKKLRKILRNLPERIEDEFDSEGDRAATTIEGPRLLYLLRHAKSSWNDPGLDDFDRPLAARGRAACKAMSEYLWLGDVRPDLVLCSSAARTRETLAGIGSVMGDDTKVRFDKHLYHGGPQALETRLRRVPDGACSVMLIGHNPALQALVLRLVGNANPEGRARMAAKFPTGALAILVLEKKSWHELGPETCQLHSFVAPRELGSA